MPEYVSPFATTMYGYDVDGDAKWWATHRHEYVKTGSELELAKMLRTVTMDNPPDRLKRKTPRKQGWQELDGFGKFQITLGFSGAFAAMVAMIVVVTMLIITAF